MCFSGGETFVRLSVMGLCVETQDGEALETERSTKIKTINGTK